MRRRRPRRLFFFPFCLTWGHRMNDTAIGLDRTEAEVLDCEVSDEALEAVAGNESLARWTMFCTGIQCPG